LALNLATTRLSAGHGADALAPAQQALTIAQANPNAGVDVRLAAVVEGHAALLAHADGAAARLGAALDAMQGDGFDADVYTAASDLGLSEFQSGRYVEARGAWQHALDASDGSAFGADIGRAYANVGLAGAIIMNGVDRHMSAQDAWAAGDALYSAARTLHSRLAYVPQSAPLPSSYKEYALAYAWGGLLAMEMAARNIHRRRDESREPIEPVDLSSGDTRPLCKHSLVQVPPLQYPPAEHDARHIGTVVLFLQTDETGAVTRHEVAAEVGAGFADSTDVMGQWRIQRTRDAESGCRLSTQTIIRVSYAF
jgi:hypothetical protein